MADSDSELAVVEAAMSAALTQYERTMGKDFPTAPRLVLDDDKAFWADAQLDGTECVITVTEGLVAAVERFWADVFEQGSTIPGTVEDMIHNSLVWLMLHELHHYEMGHFAFTGKLLITEAKDPNSFGAIQRASETRPQALQHIGEKDIAKVEPCLEMQADHDATEMLLDAYSADGWDIIRARVAAITGMMVLIERADAKLKHVLSSHPKAATRIFQLLGHVIQMPMIEQILAQQQPHTGFEPYIPSGEEQSAFNRTVVIPAFLDALHVAKISNAATTAADLGSPEDFFGDVENAKLSKFGNACHYKTQGAQEWAKLTELQLNRLSSQKSKTF